MECTHSWNVKYSPPKVGWGSSVQVIITPRACAGVKKSSVCRKVVTTKIAISRVLGIRACYNYNESVDIGEKLQLVCVRFEWLNMAHWCYKSCIFRSACLWFTDRTHCMCDATRLRMLDLNVGKGRQVMKCIQQASILAIYTSLQSLMAAERAGYVLWRALVIICDRIWQKGGTLRKTRIFATSIIFKVARALALAHGLQAV